MTQSVLTSVLEQFADEEQPSNYTYPSGYKGARSITEQTNKLRAIFSGIGFANEKLVEQSLPSIAEGYFAIPRWETIAKTYGEAVELVIAKLKETRVVYNDREGELGPEFLKQHPRTVKMFQTLREQQKGNDILVMQAQFGVRYRGRSVRRARRMFKANEFGLDAFSVAIMLLTHPERLVTYENLWIDCAGDEYQGPAADELRAPYWLFSDDKLEFGAHDVAGYCDYFGSASAVLPE